MRLLLDEHFSPMIARRLRERGHDVVAVSEGSELTSLDDAALLAVACQSRRAIVTEDVADFASLARHAERAGDQHWGLIFTSPRTFSRSSAGVGLIVTALDRWLIQNQAADALVDKTVWLGRT